MIQHDLKPMLGLWDATMIVVGTMIGSGIFIVSADIIRNVGSAPWLITVWVATGIITLIGALSYGELSALFPKAGGQYVYLKEAYSPFVAFLYGWSFFAVIQTGTIAAVGVAFAKFTGYLFPAIGENIILFKIKTGVDDCGAIKYFSITTTQVLAVICIALLTYVNSKGIKNGKRIQSVFTSTKILSLVLVIVAGLFFYFDKRVWMENWHAGWNNNRFVLFNACDKMAGYVAAAPLHGKLIMSGITAALIGTIFSSYAWENITFISAEVKNPIRTIPKSLFLGTVMVTVIYILINLAFISVLPLSGIATASNDRVGTAVAMAMIGKPGSILIAVMIMISTFGCNNGLILSGARVYYSMAKDQLFFKKADILNKFSVPQNALWMQFVVATALCLSGQYGDLLNMISFVVVLFYMITIAGIFILRIKKPALDRPYKAFGYPFLPLLYILFCGAFCICLLIYKPDYTWPGLIITMLGVPMYWLMNKYARQNKVA